MTIVTDIRKAFAEGTPRLRARATFGIGYVLLGLAGTALNGLSWRLLLAVAVIGLGLFMLSDVVYEVRAFYGERTDPDE